MTLSLLSGFVLLLAGSAIRNGGKVRLEGALDTGMNSVLGEYHVKLFERYGLLYVDASYLDREPSIANAESRLNYYVGKNLHKGDEKDAPWGSLHVKEINIVSVWPAVSGFGSAMKNQAVASVAGREGESPYAMETSFVMEEYKELENLDRRDAAGEWSAIQEQIAGIELPVILNEKGQWEEVPLGNPADGIYWLLGSDVLYLSGANMEKTGVGRIQTDAYLSGRCPEALKMGEKKEVPDGPFLIYLFEKMGNYGRRKEDSLLQYQLEYIAKGKSSDYENLRAVVETIEKWRFADNAEYVFSDASLYSDAQAVAKELYAVQLKPEFEEPVTKSILYACAYLQTIADLKCLLSGGSVDVHNNNFSVGAAQVKSGVIPGPAASDSGGFCYEQYLCGMLLLLSGDIRNIRAMDIMEMDIRMLTGDPYFAMDWCVERLQVKLYAGSGFGDQYELNRTYGYF